MSNSRKRRLMLASSLILGAAPASASAQSVPQPIRYGQYEGLDSCLDYCFGSCVLATGFYVCYSSCTAAFDVCGAGCDTICFFAPDSAACSNCRIECRNQEYICDSNCLEAVEECHQACAQSCIPQYTNTVGTPWFVGETVFDPDPITGVNFRFGTLDFPYYNLASVIAEWDSDPKTVYIESGTTNASFQGTPLVISSPTWLVNNTPENGPVTITVR